MPLTSLTIVDVDDLRLGGDRSADPRIGFTTAAEPELFRRWRPGFIRGAGARSFIDAYFHPVAQMPWAGLITIEDGRVIRDGLLLQGDRLLVGNSLMYPSAGFPYPHSPLRFERQPDDSWTVPLPNATVEIAGLTASIVCDGWQIYGHWLVDVLPRLHRVMASGLPIDTYLFPGPVRSWQMEMLEAVGLDPARCRFVDLVETPVRCERLVVATYDRFNSEVRPDIVRVHAALRARAQVDESRPPDRHLFVSRETWGGSRSLRNRAEIEAIAQAAGYEPVRPETLPFMDQIRLFDSARSVIGECGSGMHNTLFSRPGTRVGLLQDRANHNFLQSQLGMMLEHEVFYAMGEPDAVEPGAFSADAGDFRYLAYAMRN